MALHFSCDGCAKPVENPVKVGHVIQREYCPDCAEAANQYIAAEEALRKTVHERFIDDRAALIARFSANNFKLPDTP